MEGKVAKVLGSRCRVLDKRRKKPARYAAYLVQGSRLATSQVSTLKSPPLKLGKRKKPDICKAKCRTCNFASRRSLHQSYLNFMKSEIPYRLMRYVSDEWVDIPSEVIGFIRKEFELKKGVVEVNLLGHHLLLDFLHMVHLNLKTGSEHPMAWIDEGGRCFFPEVFSVDDSLGQCCHSVEIKEDLASLSGACAQHEIKLQVEIELNGVNELQPIEYCGESNPLVKRVKGGQNHVGIDAEVEDSCHRVSNSKMNTDLGGNGQLEKNFDIESQFLPSDEVMDIFLKGMPSTVGTDVINITHSQGSMLAGRVELFQKQVEITKKYRGSANVRYAWLPLSKDALSSVMTYGIGPLVLLNLKPSYGVGAHLVAVNCSSISASYCDIDENGVKHMALCRVILGNIELIEHGSKQFHPSSDNFDCGVDDLENPQIYVVWSMNVSTHIFPVYVVSFKVSPEQKGCTEDELEFGAVSTEKSLGGKSNVGLFPSNMNLGSDRHSNLTSEGSKERALDLNSGPIKTPKSPWMPFPMLFAAIADEVSSDDMRLIFGHYDLFRVNGHWLDKEYMPKRFHKKTETDSRRFSFEVHNHKDSTPGATERDGSTKAGSRELKWRFGLVCSVMCRHEAVNIVSFIGGRGEVWCGVVWCGDGLRILLCTFLTLLSMHFSFVFQIALLSRNYLCTYCLMPLFAFGWSDVYNFVS